MQYGPRFLIVPWYVNSANDRDTHFITARQLVFLYELHGGYQYRIYSEGPGNDYTGMIELTPRRNGDYIPHRDRLIAEWVQNNCDQSQTTQESSK